MERTPQNRCPYCKLSCLLLVNESPLETQLLLDELELIRADAADGADIILGQLAGVSTSTSKPQTTQTNLYVLSAMIGSFHRPLNVG